MSDGVMTPRKIIGNLIECGELLARGNLKIHCEMTKDVKNAMQFQWVLELMFNFCTLGGSQRAICPGMRYTAYATRRSYSYTSMYCMLHDMRGALGLRRLSITGTCTTLSRNWTCVISTGFCAFGNLGTNRCSTSGTSTILSVNLRGWQRTGHHRARRRWALGHRRVAAAVSVVVLLLVMSCC